MSDTPKMTDAEREALQAQLAELDDAADAIWTAMAPMRKAHDTVMAVRESLLDKHGVEIAGKCNHCEALVFEGEQGHRDMDGDMLWCEPCAPTWADVLETYGEPEPDEDEEIAEGRAAAKARVEAGEGAVKVLWTL